MALARLLLPALRWHGEGGFAGARPQMERGLELGVGGFILFGGEAGAVRDLTAELHERSPHPLLIGSDLERGAGQQFRGATPLPPAAALGSLADPSAAFRAGEVTGREARALGVNWVYAPVADLDLEPENPIVGVRAFGSDPAAVGELLRAWVRGCRRGGALSCAKHFPGHGRTVGDSHLERPTVGVDRASLQADLAPFRAAMGAGVDSLMTAHVSYPALDPTGAPATLSPPILRDLLRGEMGFGGLVVTDALVMDGLVEDTTEGAAAVHALAAGCDVLLYPRDAPAVVAALERAAASGELPAERLEDALRRVAEAAARGAGGPCGAWAHEADRRWALETAVRSVQVVRGAPRLPRGPVRIVEVEDDAGGPWPPYSRAVLPAALRQAGVEISADGTPLVAVYSDIRAWKGRPGISARARALVAGTLAAEPEATVALFSHPRLAAELETARHVLAAWGGEGIMQQAAAVWLTGSAGGLAVISEGLQT